MAYVEGVGDEVVVIVGVFVVLIVIIVVWISTSVTERTARNVIVIERARFEHLLRRFGVVHRNRNARLAQATTTRTAISSSPSQAETEHEASEPVSSTSQNVRQIVQNYASSEQEAAPTHSQHDSQNIALQTSSDTQLPVISKNERGTSAGSATEGGLPLTPLNTGPIPNNTNDSLISNISSAGQNVGVTNLSNTSHNEQTHADSCDVMSCPRDEGSCDETEAREGDIDKMRELRVAFLARQAKTSDMITQNSDYDVMTQNIDVSNQHDDINVRPSEVIDTPERSDHVQISGENSVADLDGTGNNGVMAETSRLSDQETASSSTGVDDRLEGHIRVKLRYLNERQTIVQARPEDTLEHFKRSNFAGELAENLRVRLIYNGQELRNDERSLDSYNILDNSVVHCLLSSVQIPSPARAPDIAQEFDLGHLVFPLFGLMLAMIWYCRIEYKQYFNAISTLSLMAITFMYIVAFLASRRNHEHVHEHQE